MIIKTRKSRSLMAFENIRGTSLEKLKQQMNKQESAYRKLKSKSEKKNCIRINTQQQESTEPDKGIKKHNTISLSKLPHLRRVQSLKQINLQILTNLTLKLENKKTFKTKLPNEGYVYLDLDILNNGVNEARKKLKPIAQKNGVILEHEEKDSEDQFYSVEKFDNIMKICFQIKEIEFFKNLFKMKLFWLWKNYVKKQRIQSIINLIEPKIKLIYNPRIVEIKILISEIKARKFIEPPKLIPISLMKYRQYLQNGCLRALSSLESESLLKIIKSSFQALQEQIAVEEQKLRFALNKTDVRIRHNIIKSKPKQLEIDMNIKQKYKSCFNFDKLIFRFTVYFRKMMYFLTDSSIYLFASILQEAKTALGKLHQRYLQKKNHYIQYILELGCNKLMTVNLKEEKKLTQNQPPQNKKLGSEIFCLDYEQIQIIQIPFSLDAEFNKEITIHGEQLCIIFNTYIEYIKKLVQEQNLLNIKTATDPEYEIISEIAARIDQYKSQKFTQGLIEYQQFREWLQQFSHTCVKQTHQILELIHPIIEQISDFVMTNQVMVSNEGKLKSQEMEKFHRRKGVLGNIMAKKVINKESETNKSGLINFFERKSAINYLLQHLPNYVFVSIFCISFVEIKQQFTSKINSIQNSIRKYVPENFDRIATELFQSLSQIDKKISIFNWTIQEFVCSSKGQAEYEQLHSSGNLFKKTEMLNKLLIILSQVSDYLHKEKYIKYLQLKQEVKKITIKSQEFEMKKTQKLKDLRVSLYNLKEQIWKELSIIQIQIHEKMNNQLEKISQMIKYFPSFQNQLAKIKVKIDHATFMETLRVDHCLSFDKVTQFTSYTKLQNDAKLLKQFIEKYINIKERIQLIFGESIKTHKILQIIEDIEEAINECRSIQQSLIPYSYLINKIKNEYYEYQVFFETANELSYLQAHELEQIENKKYFDFSKKKVYTIKDIFDNRLHEKQNSLSAIFMKKYYKRVLMDLIIEFEDFTDKTYLELQIEILKYVKQDSNKQKKDAPVSVKWMGQNQSDLKNQDHILQKSISDSCSSDMSNNSIYKSGKRHSVIEASSEKIPIFSNLNEIKCILMDLQIELNQLCNACQSLSEQSFNQETNQLSNSIRMFVILFDEIRQEQEKYINLLKYGSLKGSPFFEDISSQLVEANMKWSYGIIGGYSNKSLNFVLKNYKQMKKLVQSFKKLLENINSVIEAKIDNHRKQFPLLFLCSNQTIIKIMQNPLQFIHEFYTSVDQICLDPDINCLSIQTLYKERLRIIFKTKNNIQLNRIRQEISKYIKRAIYIQLQLTSLFKQHFNKNTRITGPQQRLNKGVVSSFKYESSQPGSRKIQKELSSNKFFSRNYKEEIIQVSYLIYYLQLQALFKDKQAEQINSILSKQIQYLTSQYETVQPSNEQCIIKIDLFISLCCQLRGRVKKNQQQLLNQCLAYSIEIQFQKQKAISADKIKNPVERRERKQSRISFINFQDIRNASEAYKQEGIVIMNNLKLEKRKSNNPTMRRSLISNVIKDIYDGNRRNQEQQQERRLIQKAHEEYKEPKIFKIKLNNFYQSIELNYDLIDPRYLTHYIQNQRMLLNLFNSFHDPSLPTICQNDQVLQMFSARLFRLYRKINCNKNEKMCSNIFLNCIKLSKITIALWFDDEKEQVIKKFCQFITNSISKLIKQNKNSEKKSQSDTNNTQTEASLILKLPNIFILEKNKFSYQYLKTNSNDYRTISLEIPCMEQILEMYILSLRSRFIMKNMKVILNYLKVYQFFLMELKRQKMNIEDSKEMLICLLEQIQVAYSKEFENQFGKYKNYSRKQKLKKILAMPLLAVGLKEDQIKLVIQKYVHQLQQGGEKYHANEKNHRSSSKLDHSKEKIVKQKLGDIENELKFYLNPQYLNKFSFYNKILTLLGDPAIGKSFTLKQYVRQNSHNSCLSFVNINLHTQFTKFLVSIETIEQLRIKILQKHQQSEKKRKYEMQNKLTYMTYEGFEGLPQKKVIELFEHLTDSQLLEIEDNKVKHIVQIQNLNQICPHLLPNLQIINFAKLAINHESYLKEIEQLVLAFCPQNLSNEEEVNQSHNFKSTLSNQQSLLSISIKNQASSNSMNYSGSCKAVLQKALLKIISKLVPEIYKKITGASEQSRKENIKLTFFVDERQFYCMLITIFKNCLYKHEKTWKKYLNRKILLAITSIKKTLAFAVYWSLYYSLDDIKGRSHLFSRLTEIKEFLQLYFTQVKQHFQSNVTINPTSISMFSSQNYGSTLMNTINQYPYHIPSGPLQEFTLENKILQFTDDGANFVNYEASSNDIGKFSSRLSSSLMINFHQFLYVETPQTINMNRLVDNVLYHGSNHKGIYVIGEHCIGKSKFLKNLLKNFNDINFNYNKTNKTIDAKLNKIFEIQIKKHKKNSMTKENHNKKIDDPLQNQNKNQKASKNQRSAQLFFEYKQDVHPSILRIRELSHQLYKVANNNSTSGVPLNSIQNVIFNEKQSECPHILVYIDDCSMFPEQCLTGSITHEFIKNLCEQNQFLFNQQLVTYSHFNLFYESRFSRNSKDTIKMIRQKWFLFPIIMTISSDYLPKIFSKLISNSLTVYSHNYEKVFLLSSNSIHAPTMSLDNNEQIKKYEQKCVQKTVQRIKNLLQANMKLYQNYDNKNNKILAFNNEWSLKRKENSWLYELNYKNIYKTLYDFLALIRNSDQKKVLNQQSNQKILIRPGDIDSLNPTIHSFQSNCEMLETIMMFNLTSRIKMEDKDQRGMLQNNGMVEYHDNKKYHKAKGIYKYKESSIFKKEGIDLLDQKLSQKRSLRKIILFEQFRENMYKFQYGLKTSQFLLINRCEMFDGVNFVETACEIFSLKTHRIQAMNHDFESLLARLLKMEKNNYICIYIPLETIYNYPQILNTISKEIKNIYNLNPNEYSGPLPRDRQRQRERQRNLDNGKKQSIKLIGNQSHQSFSSSANIPSVKKISKDTEYTFTFLIQYPTNFDEKAKFFVENDLLLSYSTVLWFDSVKPTSSLQSKQQTNIHTKQQELFLEGLKQKISRNSIAVEYLWQIYPKKSREDLQYYIKSLQRLFQFLERQFKQIFPSALHNYLFSFSSYLTLCRCFVDTYSRSQTEITNKTKSIQSVLSSLQFLIRQYESIKIQLGQSLKNKKQLQESIVSLHEMIDSKKKFIDSYTFSGEKDELKKLELKCQANQDKISSFIQKSQYYRSYATKAHQQINRTQIAELKYMFNSKYQAHIQLFQIIAIILGEEAIFTTPSNVENTKQLLRKSIIDVNIMSKIKDQNLLQNKPISTIRLLEQKIAKIEQRQKDKSSFMKNLIHWIKYSIKFSSSEKDKNEIIEKLRNEIEDCKTRIIQIYQKYKIQRSMAQLVQFQYTLSDKQIRLKNMSIYTEKQTIKVSKCTQIIEKFIQFDKKCKNQLAQIRQYSKSSFTDSLIASVQCCLTVSIPYEFKNEFRVKYQRFIERTLVQRQRTLKKRSKDLIEQEINIFNKIKQNEKFKIKNASFLVTEQRQRIMNIIMRTFCHQSSTYKKITIIDPYSIFVRQLSLMTDLSYICINVQQLSNPNISKAIEDINLIIIKIPNNQWTIQMIKPESKEEYVLDVNNYRVKWKKTELKLNKSQRCILLKENFTSTNQLTDQGHYIIFYDLQNLYEYEQIADKILRSFHYEETILKKEKQMKRILSIDVKNDLKTERFKDQFIKDLYKKFSNESHQQFYLIIEQICKDMTSFSLSYLNYVNQLSQKIDKFNKLINKKEYLEEIISDINRLQNFEMKDEFQRNFPLIPLKLSKQKPQINELKTQIENKNIEEIDNMRSQFMEQDNAESFARKLRVENEKNKNIKHLRKIIANSFQIVRSLMNRPSSPHLNPEFIKEVQNKNGQMSNFIYQELKINKQDLFSQSYNQKLEINTSIKNSQEEQFRNFQIQRKKETECFMDVSVLVSGLQAAYFYAKDLINQNLHPEKKYSNLNVIEQKNNKKKQLITNKESITQKMLKFFFNYLLLGINEKHSFFYMLQLRKNKIYDGNTIKITRRFNSIPMEIFKIMSIMKSLSEANPRQTLISGNFHRKGQSNPIMEKKKQGASFQNFQGQNQSKKRMSLNEHGEPIRRKSSRSSRSIIGSINMDDKEAQIESKNPKKRQSKRISNFSNSITKTKKNRSSVRYSQRSSLKQNRNRKIKDYWQFERLKLSNENIFNYNSTFQKSCQNIYRELKRKLTDKKIVYTKQEIRRLINKLIKEQSQISENEKLQMFNIFDKSQYRKRIMENALFMMKKYQLVDEQNKSEAKIIERILENCSTYQSTPVYQTLADNIIPTIPYKSQQQIKQAHHEGKNISSIVPAPQKVREKDFNIFCNVSDKYWLNFLMEVFAHCNQLALDRIKIEQKQREERQKQKQKQREQRQKQKKEGQDAEITEKNVFEIKKQTLQIKNNQLLTPPQSLETKSNEEKKEQLPFYYIIYRPTKGNSLNLREIKDLYAKVNYEKKRFVLVLQEQYYMHCRLINNPNDAILKPMCEQQSSSFFNKISSQDEIMANNSTGSLNNSYDMENDVKNSKLSLFKRSMQEIQWLLQQKNIIVIANLKLLYEEFEWRNNFMAKSNKLKYKRNQSIFLSSIRYSLTLSQFLQLVIKKNDMTLGVEQKTGRKNEKFKPRNSFSQDQQSRMMVIKNGNNEQMIKCSRRQIQTMENYKKMIKKIKMSENSLELIKTEWRLSRKIEKISEQIRFGEKRTEIISIIQNQKEAENNGGAQAEGKNQIVAYKQLIMCLESVFLPGLCRSEYIYKNIMKICKFSNKSIIDEQTIVPLLLNYHNKNNVNMEWIEKNENQYNNAQLIAYITNSLDKIKMFTCYMAQTDKHKYFHLLKPQKQTIIHKQRNKNKYIESKESISKTMSMNSEIILQQQPSQKITIKLDDSQNQVPEPSSQPNQNEPREQSHSQSSSYTSSQSPSQSSSSEEAADETNPREGQQKQQRHAKGSEQLINGCNKKQVLEIIRSIEQEHHQIQIIKSFQQLNLTLRVHNKQQLLFSNCYNFILCMSQNQFSNGFLINKIIHKILLHLQAYSIWQKYKEKIYIDNIYLPISIYLLNSILEKSNYSKFESVPINQNRESREIAKSSKAKINFDEEGKMQIYRMQPAYLNQPLYEALETNDYEYVLRLRCQLDEKQSRKGVVLGQAQFSGFYEQKDKGVGINAKVKLTLDKKPKMTNTISEKENVALCRNRIVLQCPIYLEHFKYNNLIDYKSHMCRKLELQEQEIGFGIQE